MHRAHEAGLLTYFSAGFRFEHLASAVETGVDGVGVGGAQILRYMDSGTGHHGPFLPENITRILRVRDEAERSPRGRAAALLSRLDRMRFELSIDVADEARRRDLFEHLAAGGTGDGLDRLLRDLGHVERLGRDTGHPLLGWVRRLERAGARSLLAATADDWWSTLSRLCAAARRHDLEYLSERLEDLRAVSALRDDRLPG